MVKQASAAEQEKTTVNSKDENADAGDDDDSDIDVSFATMDFSGVNFDENEDERTGLTAVSEAERMALDWERRWAFGDRTFIKDIEKGFSEESLRNVCDLFKLLSLGEYATVLRGDVAMDLLGPKFVPATDGYNVMDQLRRRMFDKITTVIHVLEIELVGVAALNLFLQANYTGPSLSEMDDSTIDTKCIQEINPHGCFTELRRLADDNLSGQDEEKKENITAPKRNTQYQNAVLSDLAVDGDWPVQVCQVPYFLLLARTVLLTLSNPTRLDWNHSRCSRSTNTHGAKGVSRSTDVESKLSPTLLQMSHKFQGTHIWSARACVAHERLLQSRMPSITLWSELENSFETCAQNLRMDDTDLPNVQAATVMLEWGLAEHHFDKPGKGKSRFLRAQTLSGLSVEVTGADGKRTKFQRKVMAQMLVRAKSAVAPSKEAVGLQKEVIKGQTIHHSEEGILLERVKFEDNDDNEVKPLTVLDQSILLALCLDVKNSNPNDGLTAEEMGAFLARVLDHHDDWMVYSTALLERSWLEFERSHARERSILQMQALADQHTNRLTITQSTRQSIEESAPVQDRLEYLHMIVYPPRWAMMQDLADRYADMGVVTSAAELYAEIEFWDDVVDCYRRAGRLAKAEEIVRERLEVEATPRMWSALGNLTNNPEHFEKAIQLSKGRFSAAFLALGAFYFEKGQLGESATQYENAVRIRPLSPQAWFRLGTLNMRLERWDKALQAFSEVVQQLPEAADAWANVAAVHMHNKHPSEAYPALVQSLKYNRNNWRVWVSKLYTCLDLRRYDEAVQACNVLLDLRKERRASDGVPALEERCVRAIVGGTVEAFTSDQGDEAAKDASRRTLSRVHALLDRISTSSDAESWVFEVLAFLHEYVGQDKHVVENLMKEYRAMLAIHGWEKDDAVVNKMSRLASNIVRIHRGVGKNEKQNRDGLLKARFLIQGIIKTIETTRVDYKTKNPNLVVDVKRLEDLLEDIAEDLS